MTESPAPESGLPPSDPQDQDLPSQSRKPRTWRFYTAIAAAVLLGCMLLTAILTTWWIRHTFYANPYQPTELSQPEETILEGKLEALDAHPSNGLHTTSPTIISSVEVPGRSRAELDAERARLDREASQGAALAKPKIDPLGDELGSDDDRRHLVLTERELNGILHTNTDLADRVRIELKEDTIRAGALIPFEADAPLVGGKTLRCKLAIRALLEEDTGRLAIYISDVTVAGIPIPNAWIGEIKNKNLVDNPVSPTTGDDGMSRFADGIRDFKISDGRIDIWLNE